MVTGSHPVVDRTADSYSCLADKFIQATKSYRRYPGLKGELRDFVAGLPDGRVLDVGCGSGRDSLFVRSLKRRLIASDISLAMLGHLRKTELHGSLVCCDITQLPFTDNSFAGVIASGVLLHLPRELCISGLCEIRRVLIPNGYTALSMKYGGGEGWRTTDEFPLKRWFSYYTPAEFARICEAAGLSVVDVAVIDRKDWFVVHAVKRN
jgi:tRNA (uracil-5-)-methyltransferase TRM9